MEIAVNRESVCLGDDIDNHSIAFILDRDTTFNSLFLDLIGQRYFPSVFGNDVVWTLFCKNIDLISWKTKENKFIYRTPIPEPPILSRKGWKNITDVHFRYYSPPIKRAKHIYLSFHGKKFHIFHDGFMPEYESFNIPKRIEKKWDKEISS